MFHLHENNTTICLFINGQWIKCLAFSFAFSFFFLGWNATYIIALCICASCEELWKADQHITLQFKLITKNNKAKWAEKTLLVVLFMKSTYLCSEEWMSHDIWQHLCTFYRSKGFWSPVVLCAVVLQMWETNSVLVLWQMFSKRWITVGFS